MATIVLYIFSGPHLGAKISLKQAKTVIGSDDSADIILFAQKEAKDFAIEKRHASISVADDVYSSRYVQIEELDGNIFLENKEAQADAENATDKLSSAEILQVEAGQVFYLGSTCMVWNFPEAIQEDIIPALFSHANQQSAPLLSDVNELADEHTEEMPIDETEDFSQSAKQKEVSLLSKRLDKIKYPLLYSILILLLLSVSVVYRTPVVDNFDEEYALLVQQLAENNLQYLTVEEREINSQQSILISGFVRNDSERTTVHNLARSLHFPVYISIGVQSDLMRAIQDSFSLYGLFLRPIMYGEEMFISGYIYNNAVEEAAFLGLANNVKDLPVIVRNVIYAEDLAPILSEEFEYEEVLYADIVYDVGQIRILGEFSEGNIEKIDGVMQKIEESYNISIVYTIFNDPRAVAEVTPPPQVATAPNSISNATTITIPESEVVQIVEISEDVNSENADNAETSTRSTTPAINSFQVSKRSEKSTTAQSDISYARAESEAVKLNSNYLESTNLLDDLMIISVHHGEIPFIALSNDQKYFEGAVLQSGYVVDSINEESINLSKGTQTRKVYFAK